MTELKTKQKPAPLLYIVIEPPLVVTIVIEPPLVVTTNSCHFVIFEHQYTEGSKSNIPCCALLARQVRATLA
jgi:hypothetical protein